MKRIAFDADGRLTVVSTLPSGLPVAVQTVPMRTKWRIEYYPTRKAMLPRVRVIRCRLVARY